MLLGLALLVYYVSYLESNDSLSLWDWVGGIAVTASFAVIFLMKMTYSWLADKDSPYPFTDAEDGPLERRRQTRSPPPHIGPRGAGVRP